MSSRRYVQRGGAGKLPPAHTMEFDTLIKNALVVTASDTYPSDVGIKGEKIATLAANLPRESARQVVDAQGHYLMPGGIDVHTHLDMPFGGTMSSDDFETGTRAAAFGGTTTLIDFAIQYKGQTLRTALDTWWKKAEGKAVIDYGFHCIITDLPDARLEEMKALVGEGISSFKLFMAYPGVFLLEDSLIFKAMQTASKQGAMICMHAENGGVIDVMVRQALAEGKTAPKYHALTRPTTAEAEATGRAIALAEMAGAPVYIVHLSCAEALEKVREAHDRGLPLQKPVRNTSTFLSRIFPSPASKEPSTFSARRCAKNGIRKNSGTAWPPTSCRWSRRTIAPSASKNRKRWARTISPKFPTAGRASRTA
jgi:dihydropyrimidinase